MALPQATISRVLQALTLFLLLVAGSIGLPAASVYGTLTCTPSMLEFATVPVGGSQTLAVKLTNTGSATLTITRVLLQGPAFGMSNLNLPFNLAPGVSTALNVTFEPVAVGPAGGTIAFFSNYSSNSVLFLTFAGTGSLPAPAALILAPTSRSFGNVKVGTSKKLSETVTNVGSSALSIDTFSLTGSGFKLSGLSLPLALSAGESFTFSLVFSPTNVGSASGKFTVAPAISGSAVSVAFTGTGTTPGQLSLSPAALSFGTVTVGKSSSTPVTLSASGTSVTVKSATLNSSEFSLSGVSFPFTIAAGTNATFNVAFAPQASGAATGKISFTSNAANIPTETVSGSGVAAPQHQVVLSWADNSSAVKGYNVYRATVSGGPYTKINASLDATTSYTDATVLGGALYYYETTAVATSGVESARSNQLKVQIPTP